MISSIYDSKSQGLYRDRVKDILIDRLCRSESMTASHYHPYMEFFYLIKGSCRIFADHSLFDLNQGDMVILPPSTLHRTQYENEVERVTLSFTIPYYQNFFDNPGDNNFVKNLKCCKIEFSDSDKSEIENIFNELLTEDKKNDQFSSINRKSLVMKFLVFLGRHICGNTQLAENINQSELSIQKAAKYIFDNFKYDVTLKMAADVAGMRDTYFSKKFREVTGYGFKEYLSHLRLQHSQEMLLETSLSVTEIASLCGFTNSNYFGDLFKKSTGLSPRDFRYRQQISNNS